MTMSEGSTNCKHCGHDAHAGAVCESARPERCYCYQMLQTTPCGNAHFCPCDACGTSESTTYKHHPNFARSHKFVPGCGSHALAAAAAP